MLRPTYHPTKSYWLQDPTPFLQHHRTTPSLPTFAQVIIIGSGISGAFAARELLEDDFRGIVNNVLMLEARKHVGRLQDEYVCFVIKENLHNPELR